jgi:hypothetical protein
VRVSVPTFQSVGALIDGSALPATVPEIVAREIIALRPQLRTRELPFGMTGAPSDDPRDLEGVGLKGYLRPLSSAPTRVPSSPSSSHIIAPRSPLLLM